MASNWTRPDFFKKKRRLQTVPLMTNFTDEKLNMNIRCVCMAIFVRDEERLSVAANLLRIIS